MSIPVCKLRNAGIIDNDMNFQDKYMNNFSPVERANILNTLRTVVSKMEPCEFLKQYTASSIFPYGQVVMLIRDNLQVLEEIRDGIK